MMMTTETKPLPQGWELIKLGQFVDSEKGKKPKYQQTTKDEKFNIPYVDIQAFEKKIVSFWTNGEGCRFCYDSDFLMVWDGSRFGLVGKGLNGALGSTLVRLNFPYTYNPYAFYFLRSKFLDINSKPKGTGTPHVNPDLVWNYNFPLPP